MGVLNGAYKEWYPSGTLKNRCSDRGREKAIFSDTSPSSWIFHGEAKAYDMSGNLQASIPYSYGDLHGEALYYFCIRRRGKKKGSLLPREKLKEIFFTLTKKGNIIGKSKHKNGNKARTHGLLGHERITSLY